MSKKILIAAGGTGGHIFPAIAVAEVLRDRGCDVLWVGVANKMEARIVPANSFPIKFIKIKGFRGKGWLHGLTMPFMMAYSVVQSLLLMFKYKPDVVLGMGGFVCAPIGLAAFLTRKKLVIHEQNKVAGFTNKALSFLASDVLSAFPDVFKSKKACVVGNPLRASILDIQKNKKVKSNKKLQQELNILVVGGSLGAAIFNKNIPLVLAACDDVKKVSILHQCGRGNKDNVLALYNDINKDCKFEVVEFIEDMASAYLWSDLVVARAGAMTIAELTAFGLPSILVPFAFAVGDHQKHNAFALSASKASIMIEERNFSVSYLSDLINKFLNKPETLNEMGLRALEFFKADSSVLVADLCIKKVNND